MYIDTGLLLGLMRPRTTKGINTYPHFLSVLIIIKNKYKLCEVTILTIKY